MESKTAEEIAIAFSLYKLETDFTNHPEWSSNFTIIYAIVCGTYLLSYLLKPSSMALERFEFCMTNPDTVRKMIEEKSNLLSLQF